jgi:transposase
MYSAAAMSAVAGAEVIMDKYGLIVRPNNDQAKAVLDNVFGKYDGSSRFYQMRTWAREFHPSWQYWVTEAMQYSIVSKKWVSRDPDPEYKGLNHEFLVTNSARAFARFMHIGIPVKNTIPKLVGRSVFIKWDEEIGKVEFKLGKLDGSRHFQWKNIVNRNWKLGAIYLNHKEKTEREPATLFLTISYTAPNSKLKDLDPEKVMTVSFGDDPEMFINCAGQEDFEGDKISVWEAVDGLESMAMIAERYKQCKASAGNPRRVWGSKKMYKSVQGKISNMTAKRTGYVRDRNHYWARRIVNNAARWQCGKIVVIDCPEESMFKHPWAWYEFRNFLGYKAREIGADIKGVNV